MIVYKAVNTKNRKVYICVTIRKFSVVVSIHRHNAAKRGLSTPIYEAMRKYGTHNFQWEILWRCQSVTEMYSLKEQFIKEADSTNRVFGYNCTTGGVHFTMIQETKDKLSESRMGFKMAEETKKKICEFMLSDLNTNRGRKFTNEARNNMSRGQRNSNYVQSAEHKKRKSETMKKRWKEPEVIERMKKRKLRDISGKNNPMYGVRRFGKDNPMYGKKPHNYGIPMTEEHKEK